MMKYSDPTRPTPDDPPPQVQQLPARFLEDRRQDSHPLRSTSGFPSPALPPCFKRVRPNCAEVAMRHLVPPGAPPSPPPPHTHHPHPCLLSAHEETNKTLKKKRHRNTITRFLAASICLLDNKTSSCPPPPRKDLWWPPLRLSICLKCTEEELERGSGGMQDGGQGTSSLHTLEEGKKKVFQRNQQLNLPLPPPILLSLSLSFLAHLLPLHPPLRPSQAESVMTVLRSMQGVAAAALSNPGDGSTSSREKTDKLARLRLRFLNWRFRIVLPLLHPGFIAGE